MQESKYLQLQLAFPRLFKAADDAPSPYSEFGIQCGDGWYDLVYKLCYDIEEVLIAAGTADDDWLHVRQVKEKFGGLRFYVSESNLKPGTATTAGMVEFRPVAANQEIRVLIKRAEDRSLEICEDCSAPGDLYSNAWIHVKCPVCEARYLKEREAFLKV